MPGEGTKILQATWCGQEKKKERERCCLVYESLNKANKILKKKKKEKKRPSYPHITIDIEPSSMVAEKYQIL